MSFLCVLKRVVSRIQGFPQNIKARQCFSIIVSEVINYANFCRLWITEWFIQRIMMCASITNVCYNYSFIHKPLILCSLKVFWWVFSPVTLIFPTISVLNFAAYNYNCKLHIKTLALVCWSPLLHKNDWGKNVFLRSWFCSFCFLTQTELLLSLLSKVKAASLDCIFSEAVTKVQLSIYFWCRNHASVMVLKLILELDAIGEEHFSV